MAAHLLCTIVLVGIFSARGSTFLFSTSFGISHVFAWKKIGFFCIVNEIGAFLMVEKKILNSIHTTHTYITYLQKFNREKMLLKESSVISET